MRGNLAMSNAMRDMPACGISLVINLSILAVFHFIVYEGYRDAAITEITSVIDEDLQQEELRFNETAMDQVGTDGVGATMSPSMSMVTAVGQQEAPLEKEVEDILNPELRPLSEVAAVVMEGDLAQAVEIK